MNRATLRLTDEFGDTLDVDTNPSEGVVMFDVQDCDRACAALSASQTRELITFLEENL